MLSRLKKENKKILANNFIVCLALTIRDRYIKGTLEHNRIDNKAPRHERP